jgi:lysophospholipase L1-like esterase
MTLRLLSLLAAMGLVSALADCPGLSPVQPPTPVHDSSKWEQAIAEFEAADRASPPRSDGVLFIGSSSIRMWNLDESFPGLGAINRGFGGSQLADSVHFASRILLPHQPKTVVLYAGDNDIAEKKPVAEVVADYQAFVKVVHTRLPKTKIVFVPIKPSLKRWNLWPQMKKANDLIAGIAADDPTLLYADIISPMLGKDGRPRAELFLEDGLHLNKKGYAVWTKVLAPLIVGAGVSSRSVRKQQD